MLRLRKTNDPVDDALNGTHRTNQSVRNKATNNNNSASRKNRACFQLWMLGLLLGSAFVAYLVGLESPRATVRRASHVSSDVAGAEKEERREPTYHLVFSTDCSEYQHWQSYLLFHSAFRVQQPGRVTRIASGCSEEDRARVQAWHDTHVRDAMSDAFGVHFTPHFSSVTSEDGTPGAQYVFFNKPFGLRHWMEHGLGMGFTAVGNNSTLHPNLFVILTDPDMLLLRPITQDFGNDRDVIAGSGRNNEERYQKVEQGRPFAQRYALGALWRSFDLDKIAGPDSPAKLVDEEDGWAYYPAGPPYIADAADMYQISLKWTEFVPKVYAEYTDHLAEMYAYCIAAAHLKLPHQMIDSLMVSNLVAWGEGWPMVDAIPNDRVCEFAMQPNHTQYAVPSVVHYCQGYSVGPHHFYKAMLPRNFFTCDSPLLLVPPMDSAIRYDYRISSDTKTEEKIDSKTAKEETFMMCALAGALNSAALYFKTHHCSPGNRQYTLAFKM